MKLVAHEDVRGKFAEVYKGKDAQVSFITINPGQVRGNHYHKVQHEQFVVIKGEAVMQTRMLEDKDVTEIVLNDSELQVFTTTPYLVHNITNRTNDECIVLLITDKPFNPEDTDTYPEVV